MKSMNFIWIAPFMVAAQRLWNREKKSYLQKHLKMRKREVEPFSILAKTYWSDSHRSSSPQSAGLTFPHSVGMQGLQTSCWTCKTLTKHIILSMPDNKPALFLLQSFRFKQWKIENINERHLGNYDHSHWNGWSDKIYCETCNTGEWIDTMKKVNIQWWYCKEKKPSFPAGKTDM